MRAKRNQVIYCTDEEKQFLKDVLVRRRAGEEFDENKKENKSFYITAEEYEKLKEYLEKIRFLAKAKKLGYEKVEEPKKFNPFTNRKKKQSQPSEVRV